MRHGVDFFRDEIRNGFYIPTAIKQSWAAHLDVLSEVDRICKKHNIRYFADWGTFLGAVRHGGFVPWDDDLDICMLRDDYQHFRQVCDEELPSNYCIHDYERHKGHWLFLSRVVNNEHIRFDDEHLLNNYNFPWLTGIDIFVKDYVYRDPDKEKKRCDDIMHLLAEAEPYLKSDPDRAIALYHQAEKRMAEVPEKEADEVVQLFPWGLKGAKGEAKRFYEKVTYLPFEDVTIPVPYCYNELLSNRYGSYNKVVKGAAAHDYPTFEGQRKGFEKETGVKLPFYTFDVVFPERDASGSVKTLAKECLEELRAYYEKIQKSADPQEISELLGNAQQLAVDLGTMLEQTKGEKDPHVKEIVKSLEEYCEAVFGLSENYSNESVKGLKAALDVVSDMHEKHLFGRKEVLFLPDGIMNWHSLKALCERECELGDTDVYVVPLPVMHKDYYGRILSSDEEINKAAAFDEYVKKLDGMNFKLMSFDEYDLALHYPEKIYIQNPYDGQNPVLTVPPYYYAENLRQFTDELIYVPIGPVSEFTENDMPDMIAMDFYVKKPGPCYADRILVQSENIRKHYVDKLTEFTQELSKEYWEKKIVADEAVCMPATLETKDQKKTILYGIAPYEYNEHQDSFETSIRSRLKLFIDNSEKVNVEILLYRGEDAQSTENAAFAKMVEKTATEYGIAIASGIDAGRYTAYYGSSLPIVQDFIALKKPVMIADYSVEVS